MNISDVQPPSNKKFGLLFTVIFILISSYLYYYNPNPYFSLIFFIFASVFLVLTIFKPSLLTFYNKLWMRFGFFLGRIVNPIVLGIIFFGLFSPIAIIMKLFNRDELRIKKINRESFWKERLPQDSNSNSFKNQF
jgi:hypothetical protein